MKQLDLKKWKVIWTLLLLAAWALVALLLYKLDGQLTVKELLRYRPASPVLAALAMLGLFVLKSVDFIMHCGVLYAADSILFPLPLALAVNTLGIAITVTPFYWIGRTLGPPVRDRLLARHPKLGLLAGLRLRHGWVQAMLFRLAALPLLPVNLFLGAEECPFWEYFIGSVLGALPEMVCFTVMGMNITRPGSREFSLALGGQLFLIASALLLYRFLQKHQQSLAEQS